MYSLQACILKYSPSNLKDERVPGRRNQSSAIWMDGWSSAHHRHFQVLYAADNSRMFYLHHHKVGYLYYTVYTLYAHMHIFSKGLVVLHAQKCAHISSYLFPCQTKHQESDWSQCCHYFPKIFSPSIVFIRECLFSTFKLKRGLAWVLTERSAGAQWNSSPNIWDILLILGMSKNGNFYRWYINHSLAQCNVRLFEHIFDTI